MNQAQIFSKVLTEITKESRTYDEVFIAELIDSVLSKTHHRQFKCLAGLTSSQIKQAIRAKLYIVAKKFNCKFSVFLKCQNVIRRKVVTVEEIEKYESNPSVEVLSIDLFSASCKSKKMKDFPNNKKVFGYREVVEIVNQKFVYSDEESKQGDKKENVFQSKKLKEPARVHQFSKSKESESKPTKKVNNPMKKRNIFDYF